MRKKLIAANWKMYKTPSEALAFVQEFLPLVAGHSRDEIALFPNDFSLTAVIDALRGSNVAAGAQNMHWLDEGAFTSQNSPVMLNGIGATHVLLGHSECRQYLHETDQELNLKLKSALEHGLTPVLCIGEMLEERQAGKTAHVLLSQLKGALTGIDPESAAKIVIAYEPVWAIGTGATATPQIANETHGIVRAEIESHFGAAIADEMRILYGGSVKPDNACDLLCQPQIDGALVGGASLNAASFAKIVQY